MKQLIQDMTDAEIVADINKLTRKPMSANQTFRYRALTDAIELRQRAQFASDVRRYSKACNVDEADMIKAIQVDELQRLQFVSWKQTEV